MPATKKSTTTKKADETPIVDETVAVEKTAPPVKSAPKQKELSPSDEVEVASNVPYRVSYEDKATADKYVWESVGEVQYMTIETLTRMRRNFPSYFEKMEVMPTDERVIKKLNLSKLCDKTEEFMSVDAYTRECVGALCFRRLRVWLSLAILSISLLFVPLRSASVSIWCLCSNTLS